MRTYVADLPGGTATTTISILKAATCHRAILTFVTAAAGSWELSLSVSPQIGTAQPTADVLARGKIGATAGNQTVTVDFTGTLQKFSLLQNVYLHQTGAGNVGNLNLMCTA